jgi:hypothetical protein
MIIISIFCIIYNIYIYLSSKPKTNGDFIHREKTEHILKDIYKHIGGQYFQKAPCGRYLEIMG